jgi:hypothetical protein
VRAAAALALALATAAVVAAAVPATAPAQRTKTMYGAAPGVSLSGELGLL